MNEKLLITSNLYKYIELEPFIILTSLFFLAWIFYRMFLNEVSEERHLNLKGHFKNISKHFAVFVVFFLSALILHEGEIDESQIYLSRALPYMALFAILWGGIIFVKVCRLITLQYLFLGSMKAGVPVLIVNILSLLISVLLSIGGLNQFFGIQVGPLIATSAAFSIILGLALQDTLGNLFAGISLQLDKSFEIDDWIEVTMGIQKITGQVKEISWRATLIIGWTDERISLPNRLLANSQISNFASGDIPIIRSHSFRINYGCDIDLAKDVILKSAKVDGVKNYPEPVCLINECTDSYIVLKLTYYIDNFGSQYSVADKVMELALTSLHKNKIDIAAPRMQISAKVLN